MAAGIAALASLVLSITALGAGDYQTGVAGGVTYSSGAWQPGGGWSSLWNNYYSQNIGNAYVELHRNGVGLVASNYPGVFIYNNDATAVSSSVNSSYVSKCKSSNTRSNAGCGH